MVSGRIGKAYDAIAPAYAARNAAISPALADLGERVLRLATVAGPRPRVLDVGCGAGGDLAWLRARRADATGTASRGWTCARGSRCAIARMSGSTGRSKNASICSGVYGHPNPWSSHQRTRPRSEPAR